MMQLSERDWWDLDNIGWTGIVYFHDDPDIEDPPGWCALSEHQNDDPFEVMLPLNWWVCP